MFALHARLRLLCDGVNQFAMEPSIRDWQVLILAGGMGTRLRPLSINSPKTLIPVCNISLLARILRELQVAGLCDATVTLPSMGEEVISQAKKARPPGFNLDIKCQSGPFGGTVPSVRELLDQRDSPVLVIYGDSLLSVDFTAFLDFHFRVRMQGAAATILSHYPSDLCLEETPGHSLYGVMAIDANGRVTRFLEKPKVTEIARGFDIANAAAFFCERSLFKNDRFLEARDFSYDIFQPAINMGLAPIYAYDIGAGFRYDIGSIRRLYEISIAILNGHIPAYIPGTQSCPGVWRGNDQVSIAGAIPPVLLGDSLQIAEKVQVGPDVILGDRCVIGFGAKVSRSIVMEGCRIGAGVVMDSCILGPHCVIENNQHLPKHTVLGAYGVVGNAIWHS